MQSTGTILFAELPVYVLGSHVVQLAVEREFFLENIPGMFFCFRDFVFVTFLRFVGRKWLRFSFFFHHKTPP
jgi:hypothetical protein